MICVDKKIAKYTPSCIMQTQYKSTVNCIIQPQCKSTVKYCFTSKQPDKKLMYRSHLLGVTL